MTDAEIDDLDSLALRKAVAEAVGWKWHDNFKTLAPSLAVQDGLKTRFRDGPLGISWDDAIAAWIASKLGEDSWMYVDEDLCAVAYEGWPKGESAGCSPASLCRALLKALAARGKP